MKKIKLFTLMLLGTLLLSFSNGCIFGGSKEKIAGSDIDVQELYAKEIKILRDDKIANNSKEKFNAIKIILNNVDLKQIYEVKQLYAILGPPTERGVGIYNGSFWRYRYEYRNEAILIDYWTSGKNILKFRIREE